MLAAVRRSVRSWAAALILFLALAALVVTGFGTGGFGGLGSLGTTGGGDTLASVDGAVLTETEVNDIINREYSRARREQPELDLAEFIASAFNPIVDQLTLAMAVQAFGGDRGLVVSDRMIDREIVNTPEFRNAAGQFDDSVFRQQLSAQNVTEAQFREDLRRSSMQRQLLGPIARGGSVPEGIAHEYANLLLERRRGSIGVVPTELLREGIAPTEQEVAAFYQSNRARFTIPERRVIRYAMIGPEQVADATRATEAEVAAYYRDNSATYGPQETRDLQSIVLPDEAAAQRFVQSVRGGTAFAAAAQAVGFGAADIAAPDQTRETFAGRTAAEVANAAFAADQGTVVGPIRSPLGFHVVRIDSIERTPARALETVRDEIVQAIEQRKLVDALGGLVTRVEDRLAEGASLEEIAAVERLQVVTTPPITEAGRSEDGAWNLPADVQPLLRAAFEIDADAPEPLVEQIEANRRFAIVGVDRVIAAAPPPLTQIRDQVREVLIQRRALERARTIARQIAERINGGMAPAEAFAQAQAQPRLPTPQPVDMLRLDISNAGQQVPPPLATLFSIAQGQAQVIPAPEGRGWFVVHHAERTPGDAAERAELVAMMRAQFTRTSAAEMAEQFARAVARATNVERNDEAIARMRQRLVGSVLE